MGLSKSNLNFNINSYDEISMIGYDFMQHHTDKDLITVSDHFVVKDFSPIELAEYIQKTKGGKIGGYGNSVIAVENHELPFIIFVNRPQGRSLERKKISITISATGPVEFVKNLFKDFDKKFNKYKEATIDWWFVAGKGEIRSASFVMDEPTEIYDEFYPWITKGPASFFKSFMESNNPILFLSGDPGTGKTSFLRRMIYDNALDVYVGYDQKLYDEDGMLITFISSSAQLMVFEDAEQLVIPRKSGNTMMARFLNVSDGLIKFPKKKFIFTTNESNFSNVDEALLRPGRCFGKIEFRPLSKNEALTLTEVARIKMPKEDKQFYTLAELYNQTSNKVEVTKVGF